MLGCKSSRKQPATAGVNQPPADSIELVFSYGSEKEKWINEVTARFNAEDHRAPGGERIFVRAIPMGSGQCIDEVLEGRHQPHIVSPASTAFIKLGNAESQSKTGKQP